MYFLEWEMASELFIRAVHLLGKWDDFSFAFHFLYPFEMGCFRMLWLNIEQRNQNNSILIYPASSQINKCWYLKSMFDSHIA